MLSHQDDEPLHNSSNDDDLELSGVQIQRPPHEWTRMRYVAASLVGILLLLFLAALAFVIATRTSNSGKLHVIVIIGDGMGPMSVTLSRLFANVTQLRFESHLIGAVTTYSSDSAVTDSAAGATAMSCGLKTYNGAIGVDSQGKPCGTILEAAKLRGWRTGLVATSRLTHATPASFSAHVSSRASEMDIAKQQVNMEVDVMLGGGGFYFDQLRDNITDAGYHSIYTRDELLNTSHVKLPLFGIFAPQHLDYVIDRKADTTLPSLAEMTKTALNLLSSSGENFFLMVEGSRIDMAEHNNDAGTMVRELLALDDAIGEILSFASSHRNTLVVMTADHDTGGMSLGSVHDWASPYALHADVLQKQSASAEQIVAELLSQNTFTTAAVVSAIQKYIQPPLSDAEKLVIQNSLSVLNGQTPSQIGSALAPTIGQLMSARALIQFGTWGHTAVDVPLYVWGDRAAAFLAAGERFLGLLDNTSIAKRIARMSQFNLQQITDKLIKEEAKRSSSSSSSSQQKKESKDSAHHFSIDFGAYKKK